MGHKLQKETGMGLLARDRDHLQVILSFFTKTKNVANTSFVFVCADTVKDWNSITMKTMDSSATGGEYSYLHALMQQKLRVILWFLGDSDLSM